ncbi:hypothetical protein AALO_G00266200 [Alosa alosa]|uniref:Uncharacterized protein n=1 Tax=Alosa alosa TaxID=278164 RepID=A0AAV6FP65_9TELE|nr:hypothetical protein AALO_G00266200 [Alosa alosa]
MSSYGMAAGGQCPEPSPPKPTCCVSVADSYSTVNWPGWSAPDPEGDPLHLQKKCQIMIYSTMLPGETDANTLPLISSLKTLTHS